MNYWGSRLIDGLGSVFRMHLLELWTGGFLMFCAIYDFYFQGKNHFFVYLFLQSCAFLIMGFGYVGTFLPSYS
jgi:beta-mannan synthase